MVVKAKPFDADAAFTEAVVDYPPFPFIWQKEEHALPNMALLSSNEAVALADQMKAASTPMNESVNGDGDPEGADEGDPGGGDPEEFFALLTLLDQIVGGDAAVALREMPGVVLADLLFQWEQTSMESMGDSGKEPSPPSPRNRAERRSKPTSKPKAKTSGGSRSTKSATKSAA